MKYVLRLVALYAILAITFPLAQFATQQADFLVVIALRMLIAGSGLLLFHSLVLKRSLIVHSSDYGLFLKTALFHVYLAFVPEFWALQFLSPLKVNLMYSATPFINALLEYLLHNRLLSTRHIFGIGIGFIGLLFLIFSTQTTPCTIKICTYAYLPELILAIAIISAAYAWFYVIRLMRRNYHLMHINGIAMLIGGLMSSLTLVIVGPMQPGALIINWHNTLMAIALLIILSNVIVYGLYGTLLRHYRPTFMAFAGFLTPLFGTFYAWILFKEPVTWHFLVTLVLIAIGLAIFYQAEQVQAKIPPPHGG